MTASDYHIFFKIVTEGAVDLSDSTFGILIDDVTTNTGTNNDEAVAHTRQTGGGTNYGLHIYVEWCWLLQ